MTKRRLTVSVRIPQYVVLRNRWRRRIHTAVQERMLKRGVKYRDDDQLELTVRLYLTPADVLIHDVDNRLKDIMDALQKRVGGPKAVQKLSRLVRNDRQIYRVTVEKAVAPWQSHDRGHLTIRRFDP